MIGTPKRSVYLTGCADSSIEIAKSGSQAITDDDATPFVGLCFFDDLLRTVTATIRSYLEATDMQYSGAPSNHC